MRDCRFDVELSKLISFCNEELPFGKDSKYSYYLDENRYAYVIKCIGFLGKRTLALEILFTKDELYNEQDINYLKWKIIEICNKAIGEVTGVAEIAWLPSSAYNPSPRSDTQWLKFLALTCPLPQTLNRV